MTLTLTLIVLTLIVSLDIDATEVIANKANAQWTYKKHKGYMPMVGHIARTVHYPKTFDNF